MNKKAIAIFVIFALLTSFIMPSYATNYEYSVRLQSSKSFADIGETVAYSLIISDGFTVLDGIIEFDPAYFEYLAGSAVATDLMTTEINTSVDGCIYFASASTDSVPAGMVLTFVLRVKRLYGTVSLRLKEALDSADKDVTSLIHVHNLVEWVVVKDPTCTETGVKQLICSECGETLQVKQMPLIAHNQGEWTVLHEPTCTDSGERIAYCTFCGNVASREAIPPLCHKNSRWVTVRSATHSEEGLQGLLCSDCGQMIKWQTIPILTQAPGENGIGDIDQDGSVTIADYSLLKFYINGRLAFTNEEIILADINVDGTADAFDLFKINKLINTGGC